MIEGRGEVEMLLSSFFVGISGLEKALSELVVSCIINLDSIIECVCLAGRKIRFMNRFYIS